MSGIGLICGNTLELCYFIEMLPKGKVTMMLTFGFITGKLNGLLLVLMLRYITQEDKYFIYGTIAI